MSARLVSLVLGAGFGFVIAGARMSDAAVIRDMLLFRDLEPFFVMGSAVAVAAIGVRVLRALRAKAWVGGEAVSWTTEKPALRHVAGAALFGAGWSLAGTCPGPAAVMIGEGQLAGLVVAGGIAVGAAAQPVLARAWSRLGAREVPGAAGL